jgi:tight adherence protein B
VFGAGWCALILVAFAACGVAAATSVAVLAGVVTLRLRRRRGLRRTARDAQSMAAALEVLVSELRVGAHPVRAFVVAASESRGGVATAFREVAARALLGADVAAGLRSAAAHSARPADWERMAVFWQLAVNHGLAVATLMRAAQRDIVERQRFWSRVDAGMAGARATASILAGLPLLGVALGQLIGAQPVSFLLGGGAGGWFLLIGTALVCCGLLWADHITGRVTA